MRAVFWSACASPHVKLIFINRYFWPDESASSQMLSDLAFGLAQANADREVWVITSRLRYAGDGDQLASEEIVRGVHVIRTWTSHFGRGNLIGRAIDYLTFYLTAAWALLWLARRGDIIVAKTDPPLLSVMVAPIAKLRGARLVNWLQDVFPEVAIALGMGGKGSGLLAGLRDLSLQAASANVAIGDLMAERICGRGVADDRVAVIPNWADGDAISPVAREDNALRRAWGLEGKFVVAYAGNLGRAHDMATIVDAIAATEREGGGWIEWVFIGAGAQYGALCGQIEARGAKSVHFHPYQPRERLAEALCVGDVHLVSLQPKLEGLIVPSKLYGVLAAGRPAIFIGARDGEVARVLAAGRCGATVAPGDGAQLARIVMEWSRDRRHVQAMGARARGLLDARYERRLALQRWQTLLDTIAEGKSPSADPILLELPSQAPTRRTVGGTD